MSASRSLTVSAVSLLRKTAVHWSTTGVASNRCGSLEEHLNLFPIVGTVHCSALKVAVST